MSVREGPSFEGSQTKEFGYASFNNCQIPIVVVEIETTEEQTATTAILEDEVVLNPRLPAGDMAGLGVSHKKGEPNVADILLFPNSSEAATYSAEEDRRDLSKQEDVMIEARPRGYNGDNPPGNRKLKVISPGAEVYFSVPLDHVSSLWHFEVPFRLALEHDVSSRPPYSYVAFFREDLSESNRSALTASPSRSTSPENTLLHEAGHADPPKTQ